MLMGLLAVVASLLGCAKPADFDALQADLRSRLDLIQGARVTQALWLPSGVEHAVTVKMQLDRDDPQLGEAVAGAAMEAIAETAVASKTSPTGLISLRVFGTDGEVMLKGEDLGLPSGLIELLEGH